MPKHLATGSVEPPLSPGKLRLYGMRFCPYDHRVHLVLLAKSVLHDVVWINLKNKPEWYLKKIPTAKVPALAVDGDYMWESLIISDYLDEKYPERPLHSRDPMRKAKDRILIEAFGKVSGLFYKFIMNKPSPVKEDLEALVAEMTVFDQELAKRGTTFFSGAQPGMVDYMIWPWFERFGAAKIVFGDQFDITSGNHTKIPHIVSWMTAMKEDKVVKEYALDPEIQAQYLKSYTSGNPEFDLEI